MHTAEKECSWLGCLVAALVGLVVDTGLREENFLASRCVRDGIEGVSDCSRAVVPAGRVVTGSECEVPPRQPSLLRGSGCSESRPSLS